MQYNFTIERQQWNTGFRTSYIGTAMRQGVYQYNYNSPVPNTQPYHRQAAAVPQPPGHLLCHQRRRPPVQRPDAGSDAAPGQRAVLPEFVDLGARPLRPGLQLGFQQRQVHARRIRATGSGKSARRRRFRRTVGHQLHLPNYRSGRAGTSAANVSRLGTCWWAAGRFPASTPSSPASS